MPAFQHAGGCAVTRPLAPDRPRWPRRGATDPSPPALSHKGRGSRTGPLSPGGGREASEVEAGLGLEASLEGVLDLGHLRHEVGELHQLLGGVAAGEDHVHVGGTLA